MILELSNEEERYSNNQINRHNSFSRKPTDDRSSNSNSDSLSKNKSLANCKITYQNISSNSLPKTVSELRRMYIEKLVRFDYLSKDAIDEKIDQESYLQNLNNINLVKKEKEKPYNSIIIFDWDDTLLCSTYLMNNNLLESQLEISEGIRNVGVFESISKIEEKLMVNSKHSEKISKLETYVIKILDIAVKYGDVYIITNAAEGWVEYSAQRYYPILWNSGILQKIKIISARGKYEKEFPDDAMEWKIKTFIDVGKTYKNKVTNIICLGDSILEIEATHQLANIFDEIYIKTIKFKEEPKIDQIIKQLEMVSNQFNEIHSSVRNISIQVEKKAKSQKNTIHSTGRKSKKSIHNKTLE